MDNETADVLVLGAGVAGLAATQRLTQAGLRVRVIEARERTGGRIMTQHVPGYPLPIELGAEFIHGRTPVSFALVEQAGLLVYAITGESWMARNRQLALGDDLWQQADQIFAQMAAAGAADSSFHTFIARFKHDPAWRDAAALAVRYVEGFDAADTRTASVQALVREQQAAAAIDGDHTFRIAHGYDRLVDALAAGCAPSHTAMELGTVAHRVAWRRGHVAIETTANGGAGQRRFIAPRALITLPLGVLQAPAGARGAVAFHPALADHGAAARQLAMGQVVKTTLRFRERFWEHDRLPLADPAMDPRQVSFILADDAPVPTWWTAYPVLAPQITAWAGGPAAERLLALPAQARVDQTLDALAGVLGVPRERIGDMLVATHSHDWHADPFARGAYSYVTVDGLEAVRRLAASVEDTLFFAGEATNSDGDTGTVHGAIATGQRAADELLRAAA